MPSKSEAQHKLMEGVAHNPAFAKKVGVPQSVGKDFAAADKGKKKFSGKKKAAPKSAAQTMYPSNPGAPA